MSALFASGRIVDLIIAVLAIEIVVLRIFRFNVANLIVAALPGIFLLLALRASLSGASWIWMALWLTASFPAHLADLWRRRP